jgi:hypothetical protein
VTRTSTAVALASAPAAARTAPGDLAALRRRLAGATAREAVIVDFLEDDLRETEAALGEVAGWLDAVLDALADPRAGRERYAAIVARDPSEAVEYLGSTLASVRRRVAQVSAGLARADSARR